MSEPIGEQSRTDDRETESASPSRSTTSDTARDVPAESSEVGPSRAVLGPFTMREVVFGGGVLLMFVATLLPFVDGRVLYTTFWSSDSLFFVGIGILLPVIALALLAGRRLGSSGLRVGSLSVDQFASVTAVLAATFFFLQTVTTFQLGAFLALVGSLGLLAATVVGPFFPVLKDDFTDRPEVAAHPLARPITAAKPRPPKPVKPAPETTESSGSDSASDSDAASASGSDSASSSASVPGSASSASAGTQDYSSGTYDDDVSLTGARSPGSGDGDTWGVGSASEGQGAVRGFATSAGPASAAVGSTTAQRSGAVRSGGSTEASLRDESDVAASPVTAATPADDDRAGARAVQAPSVEQDPGEGGAPGSNGTSGTSVGLDGTGSDREARVDRKASARESEVQETRVHEPVRDETATISGSGTERARQEPITATRSADEEHVVEAFWFAVGSPRPVFDEQTGKQIFVLQPGDWEVGIEDRGRDFLVQDKRSGVVGILRDLRNIERAPRD